MPKDKSDCYNSLLLEFVAETQKQMMLRGITVKKLAPALEMKEGNLYAKFRDPRKFTLKQLLALHGRVGTFPQV